MIPHIKKILYATDLSRNSIYAFHFAAALAKKHDARIVILHAIPSIPVAPQVEGGLADAHRALEKMQVRKKEKDITEMKRRLQEFCRQAESEIGPACVEFL